MDYRSHPAAAAAAADATAAIREAAAAAREAAAAVREAAAAARHGRRFWLLVAVFFII